MRKTAVSVMSVLILLVASFPVLVKPIYGDEGTENSWLSRASMGWARGYLGVATVNGKIIRYRR